MNYDVHSLLNQITQLQNENEKLKEEIKKIKTMYSNTIKIKLDLHDRTKILEKQIKYLEQEKEELLRSIEEGSNE